LPIWNFSVEKAETNHQWELYINADSKYWVFEVHAEKAKNMSNIGSKYWLCEGHFTIQTEDLSVAVTILSKHLS
jgi:hypothetical protein